MSLSDSTLSYYRAYRRANADKHREAQKRYYNSDSGKRYREDRKELIRLSKRCFYLKRTGQLDKLAETQLLLAEEKKQFPQQVTGVKRQFSDEEYDARRRASHRKQRYKGEVLGFKTLEDFIAPSTCEVCGSSDRISMDHCHVSKEFRGWLCNSCNLLLGYAGDNIQLLERIIEYLIRHKRVLRDRQKVA